MTPRRVAPAPEPKPLLKVQQAAQILGLDPSQVYRLMDAGELASIRIPSRGGGPGARRIEQTEICAFIDRNRVPA